MISDRIRKLAASRLEDHMDLSKAIDINFLNARERAIQMLRLEDFRLANPGQKSPLHRQAAAYMPLDWDGEPEEYVEVLIKNLHQARIRKDYQAADAIKAKIKVIDGGFWNVAEARHGTYYGMI